MDVPAKTPDEGSSTRRGIFDMNRTMKIAAATIALLGMAATATPAAAQEFHSVVEKVLMSQQTGPVSRLPDERKRALVSCVNGVLADLPSGKKRFVVQAASFDEMQARFGKVVMENRAEWKQKIARACASVAMA